MDHHHDYVKLNVSLNLNSKSNNKYNNNYKFSRKKANYDYNLISNKLSQLDWSILKIHDNVNDMLISFYSIIFIFIYLTR